MGSLKLREPQQVMKVFMKHPVANDRCYLDVSNRIIFFMLFFINVTMMLHDVSYFFMLAIIENKTQMIDVTWMSITPSRWSNRSHLSGCSGDGGFSGNLPAAVKKSAFLSHHMWMYHFSTDLEVRNTNSASFCIPQTSAGTLVLLKDVIQNSS